MVGDGLGMVWDGLGMVLGWFGDGLGMVWGWLGWGTGSHHAALARGQDAETVLSKLAFLSWEGMEGLTTNRCTTFPHARRQRLID